jgi:hypothetical protein
MLACFIAFAIRVLSLRQLATRTWPDWYADLRKYLVDSIERQRWPYLHFPRARPMSGVLEQ